jgi:hypothetical protein
MDARLVGEGEPLLSAAGLPRPTVTEERSIMAMRSLRLVSVPALAMAMVLAVPGLSPALAFADSLVPFHATVSETFTAAPCGPTARCITAIGTGYATHLGAITETATVVVDLDPTHAQQGCAPEVRTTTLTAADGDTITMHGAGFSCAATSDAHDSYEITGGTGRFEGAWGNGLEYNIHTFTGPGVGVSTVTYDGTISSVGSL